MPTPREVEDLARARFGDPNPRLSTRKELRFGNKGSLCVALEGEKAGLWYSWEENRGGTLLGDQRPPERRTEHSRRSLLTWGADSEPQFRRVLSQLRPVEDAPGAVAYLRRRAIDRWPHSVRGWPAGICYVAQTRDGSPLALQILPLTSDGAKNPSYWADGVTKRTYISCRGWQHFAAVRMPGRGEPILCEGAETGMSLWIATGRPVLACLGLAGLRDLKVGKRLTIACDGDAADSAAAKFTSQAKSEREKHSQRVKLAIPPLGEDFNDVHQLRGIEAIRSIIKDAS